jgi:hypothetical protein
MNRLGNEARRRPNTRSIAPAAPNARPGGGAETDPSRAQAMQRPSPRPSPARGDPGGAAARAEAKFLVGGRLADALHAGAGRLWGDRPCPAQLQVPMRPPRAAGCIVEGWGGSASGMRLQHTTEAGKIRFSHVNPSNPSPRPPHQGE